MDNVAQMGCERELIPLTSADPTTNLPSHETPASSNNNRMACQVCLGSVDLALPYSFLKGGVLLSATGLARLAYLAKNQALAPNVLRRYRNDDAAVDV